MRLGLGFSYVHRSPSDLISGAQAAEALGFHSVWTSEAYGYDAVTPLTWMAAHTQRVRLGTAILQMPARTPAMTAMTAVTLDFLSQGRVLLGLGVSGPQVVEGWHGVPYGKPLVRSREFVDIVRRIIARQEPLEHHGQQYEIPVSGGTGLGKPLRLISAPVRDRIPIYLAALGPKNVALAAEVADGWLPIFFSPRHFDAFRPQLEEGLSRTEGKTLADLDIAPMVQVVVGNDLDACRAQVKPQIALYVGGMGAKGKNFYHDLVSRYGYEEAADEIQRLFLSGHKREAAAAVPDDLVDDVALCGPADRIADRLQLWNDIGVGTMICAVNSAQSLPVIAGAAAKL